MQKVAILTHRAITEDVLSLLHREGVLEVIVPPEGTSVSPDHIQVNFEKAELAEVIGILQQYTSPLALGSKPTVVDDVERRAMATDIRGIIDRTQEIRNECVSITSLQQKLMQEKQILLPWRNAPADAAVTKKIVTHYGFLSTSALEECEKAIRVECPRTAWTVLPEETVGTTACIIHVWKADASRCVEIMTSYGWTEAVFPQVEGGIANALVHIDTEMHVLEQRNHTLLKELALLAQELPNLRSMQILMGWLDEKQHVREAMRISPFTATIFGWIARDNVARLEAKIHALSSASALLRLQPDAGEEIPVLIRNNLLITPFESVTKLYGLPQASEMDPTTALSPFFILYFGLCLTDAGYGLVLALLTGIYLWVKRASIKENTLVWLLFLSGIVTVIVSIPFGGWFGVSPSMAPDWLTYTAKNGERLFLGQIWNLGATDGITFFQNLALALGLTHLAFGIFLAGVHKWKHGDWRGALWGDFTVHLVFACSLLYAFTPVDLQQTTYAALLMSIALLIWGKGYGHRWFLRPVMGLIGSLNLAIGILSNGLSYLRILALGLVTGAIAFAVDQVAIEMGKLFPIWLGIPVMIIILVVGHLVSIALNVLGAFIHSGRLQFIEFFSQFFEGGGRPFAPFAKSIPQ